MSSSCRVKYLSRNVHVQSNVNYRSQIFHVVQNEDYSLRMPSPPNIFIQQAPDECDLQTPSPSEVYCENEKYQEALQEIISKYSHPMSSLEWKYEWRRQAQQILPYLYLGPALAARDTEFLKRENVTMLLGIRQNATASARLLDGTKIAHQLGIESTAIDVSGLSCLITMFPRATQVINDHIISIFRQSKGLRIGKVLVFCESGNERSAAVISAYLMATYGLDLISAIHRVQARRFCIFLDSNLKNLLLNYMEILIAKRDVACVESQLLTSVQTTKNGIKRVLYQGTMEEDVYGTMDPSYDEQRFIDRGDLAPFR